VLIIADKTAKRMSIHKFKKMIYSSHFDQDDTEHTQQKTVEVKIAVTLIGTDFSRAKVLSVELEKMMK